MSARELVLASNNPHKVAEFGRLLGSLGWVVRSLADWPELGELPEDGDTFAANARQKAAYVVERTGLCALADDSGLEVFSLGGLPGVRSKRFTPEATAEANNRALLSRLEGVEDRRARFVCALALVGPELEEVVEGAVYGRIGYAPRGENGFGYDPIFLPDETPGRTMAELEPEQKDALSHRGRATAALVGLLGRAGW